MAIELRVRERGAKAFQARMRQIQAPAVGDVHKRALGRGGERVRSTAKTVYLSGKALQSRTGRLMRSIRIDRGGLPRYVEVGSNLIYAAPHEFGWPGHNLPARPFMRPAGERELKGIADIYAEEVDRALEAKS